MKLFGINLSYLYIIVPLGLAAFTHIWNPTGFPVGLSFDENVYLRRAMNILAGQGPQEDPFFYDHPYFGQILLAAVLRIVGYPYSLSPTIGDANSIELLYLVPRVFMGLLAVVDTFLVYKIAQRRYDNTIGLIASTIFAVMPMSLLLRRVWLEPLLLPFLLSSILFAIISSSNSSRNVTVHSQNINKQQVKFIFLSGIFLGTAIFTKIPLLIMVPLVGYLVYHNTRNNSRPKIVGLWFIPVIFIPLIWPAYAISTGHFEHWMAGLFWQLDREGRNLFYALSYNFDLDPLMMCFGIAAVVFAAIKRDIFLLLWVIPFIVFLYFIGFVSYWHLIPLIPAFCIAIAAMVIDVSKKIRIKRISKTVLYVAVTSIVVLGLSGTVNLVNIDASSSYNEAAAFVTEYLDSITMKKDENGVVVISDPFYEWIPRYVFNLNRINYRDYFSDKTLSEEHALLVVDQGFKDAMFRNDEISKHLLKIYNNTEIIAEFGELDSSHLVTVRR